MTSLYVNDLTKSFGNTAVLRGVDLGVEDGGITSILGPSGCGKTTLLRLVAGFDRPDGGSVRLGERVVAAARTWSPPEKRGIGYVAQEGALFPHLTVAANIAFGLPLRERRSGRRIDELLELVSLDPVLAKRQPHELSGGQQQRVALARALARKPGLVLLDEPFSSLDAGLRVATREAVAATLREQGVTALLVTHDQSEALSFADQVAVMRNGRFAQVGSAKEIYETPADLDTALMVGEAAVLDGHVSNERVYSVLGDFAAPGAVNADVSLVLRPEQLELAAGGTCVVVDCTYYGADLIALVRLGDSSDNLVRVRLPGMQGIAAGERVTVSIRGTAPFFPRTT
jgi:iron(III) transport system ATP-binding protein